MLKKSEIFKFLKNREIITYLVFGILTTIINYLVYILCRTYIGVDQVILNTFIAWFAAVIFAYITNKLWVFNNWNLKKSHLLKEFTSFLTSRLFSGLVDISIMKIFVDMLGFNDLITKILSNIVVIILNYLISKRIFIKTYKK